MFNITITLFTDILGKTLCETLRLYFTHKDKIFDSKSLETRSENFDKFLKAEFGENTVMASLGENKPRYGLIIKC